MNYEQVERWFGFFILFLLGLLVFFPLMGTGFTTNDDAYYAFHAGTSWQAMLGTMHEEAVFQGRFYKYFFFLLLTLPHFFQNPAVTIAINIVAISANVLLAALLLGRLFSARLGMLFALFFLALLQDHWGHSLLTSYPLSRQVGLLFCLLCWHFLLNWRQRGLQRWFQGSLALYFLALCCNEFFILFVPLHLIVFLLSGSGREDENEYGPGTRRGLLMSAIAFSCVAVLYLALYLGYRRLFPSAYGGTEASLGDLNGYWAVLKQFSLSAMPLVVFFKERLSLSRYAPYFSMDSSAMLLDRLQYQLANFRQWNTAWMVQAILAGVGFVVFSWNAHVRMSWKKYCLFGVFGVLILFLPNALLGLTEKYRQWVSEGTYAYAFTYHSFYGVCLLLVLLTALCNALLGRWRRIRAVALCALGVFLAAATFLTAYSNDSIARTKRLAAQRWELANALFDSAIYHDFSAGTRIAAPTLFSCFRILCPPPEYWSEYAAQRTGKKVRILDYFPEVPQQEASAAQPLYYAQLHQAFNNSSQFLTLADVRTPSTEGSVLSSQVHLFVKTRARMVRILCPVRPGAAPPTLRQKPMHQSACGLFVADVTLDTAKNITLITITGDDILSKEIVITEQFSYPALR